MAATQTHQGRAYTREEIEGVLRDALTTLMADGASFGSLSVEKLRTEAGISRSSFYVYFQDKADMLIALEAGSLKRLYGTQRAWISRGEDCTREDIRACMRELLDRYLEDEVVMRAIGEASASEPAVRDSSIAGVRGYARQMERLIRTLQAAGRAQHLHPAQTGEALAWTTERNVFICAPGSTPRRRDQIAEALTDIVWSTLFSA